MERRYRATVRGRFGDLDSAQRSALLAEIDRLRLGFSAEPALHYDRALYALTYRLELTVRNANPADSDVEAELVAEDMAIADLARRGLPYRDLKVAGLTSMDDMKVNRPSRLASGKAG